MSDVVDDAAVGDAAVRGARRDGIAVGLATAAYGISFGALAVASGLDVWQACFLSIVMFTGGSQFALVGVVASGGVATGGSAVAAAALLGAATSSPGCACIRSSASTGCCIRSRPRG